MIVGFIGDVDHDDVQGDPTQTAWMIWNTADPMTTNTNSACKKSIYKPSLIFLWLKTYNKLWANWVLVICFGGLGDIAPLHHILCVLLIGLSHLWSARHLDCC